MLGKLIKYDLRSCWKKFWPIWSALIILSVINAWSLVYCEKTSNYGFTVDALPKIVLGAVCIAAFVIALVYIEQECEKGLLGREGYLRFTLPATVTEHIASKGITALILEAISGLVALICTLIMGFISAPEYLEIRLVEIIRFLNVQHGWGIILLFIFSLLVLAVMTALTFNFHIYLPLSVGHLFQKKRSIIAVASVLALCVLSIILLRQCINIINVVFPLATRTVLAELAAYDWKNKFLLSTAAVGIVIGCEIIYSVLMFFGVKVILEKHLNLD